jgi:cytidylate kinase
MERDGLTEEGAHREIHKIDAERRQYIKRHYGIEWDDPQHYHMILNTGQIGVDRTASLIVDTALYGNPT